MKFTIDIDQIINWCKKHLKFVKPAIFLALSWFFAKNTENTFVGIWHGVMCGVFAFVAIALFVCAESND